ncbi:MAG: DNA gyrase inhibitor YacG [Planctomycetaceae bacterium]|jgi:endogenous inhibitor of DNA gyrase (YacG/DUF329 family)|nr:DNA gyrase inhibitor YacG [Planctomycetaceae bacterium]
MNCSICGRIFSESTPDAAMPFCSQRCKMIDAGRWLNEEYGLPVENDNPIPKSFELELSENRPDKNNSGVHE